MDRVNILLVHTHPLDFLGGAELGLKMLVSQAPAPVKVEIIQPEQAADLNTFDAVILANLRPSGAVGEEGEIAPARSWYFRLLGYRGYVLRSEQDVHPCGLRSAECVICPSYHRIPCACSSLIPAAYKKLYNRCHAVHYLSPAHQQVINAIIPVCTKQIAIAPPIDLSQFTNQVPWQQRRRAALILGDSIRVAAGADDRARREGFEPIRIPYLSVPYVEMPRLFNEFQAVVIDPIMFHAFGRICVEALACGCKALASPRVGAMSWPDPIEAVQNASRHFWDFLLREIQAHGAGSGR